MTVSDEPCAGGAGAAPGLVGEWEAEVTHLEGPLSGLQETHRLLLLCAGLCAQRPPRPGIGTWSASGDELTVTLDVMVRDGGDETGPSMIVHTVARATLSPDGVGFNGDSESTVITVGTGESAVHHTKVRATRVAHS